MDLSQRHRYTKAAWGDFDRARNKARRTRVLSLLTKARDDLPAFEQIRERVKPNGESYAGCKTIRVEKIVGSENRSRDFNKDFMPRKKFMRHRWCSVAAAFFLGTILPPIRVLELDGVYFIRDGNHRVSVARSMKVAYIDAEVTKLSSEPALDAVRSPADRATIGMPAGTGSLA